MAATVVISESNGAGPDVHDNVTNINMGSTDAYELVAASYPITAGTNAYEKWVRIKLEDLGGSQYIKTFKVWKSAGTLTGSDKLYIYATESGYASKYPYAQPVTTNSTYATYYIAEAEPSGANIGFNNSLSATMGLDQYSDYIVMQLRVDGSTTQGTTATVSFKYEEVA